MIFYITGSNAFLLSSDLSTLFTGRFIEIQVYPFSLKEYCAYYRFDSTTPKLLDKYVTEGGLAGSYIYTDKQDQVTYVKNVCYTVIKRDLVDKYAIKEEALLDTLAEYLMDNISNLTSANKNNDNSKKRINLMSIT